MPKSKGKQSAVGKDVDHKSRRAHKDEKGTATCAWKAPGKPSLIPRAVCASIAKMAQEVKSLQEQRAAKLGVWTGKDSKADVSALDHAIEATTKAMAQEKAILSSALGTRTVLFRLPISFTLATSGGVGVCNAVLGVNVSQSPEWTSLTELFDEFRVVGGHLRFMLCGPAGNLITSGSTTFTSNTLFSMGYDPADSTTPTSSRNVSELAQHVLVAPAIRYAGAAGAYTGQFEGTHALHYNLAKVPAGYTSGGATFSGQWKSTSSGPFQDGWVKVYCATAMGTLNDVFVAGIHYVDVELRSRT